MPFWILLCVICLCVGCVGRIEDAAKFDFANEPLAPSPSSPAGSGAYGAASRGAAGGATANAGRAGRASSAGRAAGGVSAGSGGAASSGGAGSGSTGTATDTFDPEQPNAVGASVGAGTLSRPALGPAPVVGGKVSGAPFVLVKNWDFGANGTIKNMNDLIAEFQFHDQFNTIANGTKYSAVTVAPTAATAIAASGLGLPNNRQPVEDPSRPYREFTADSIKTYVRPLSPSSTMVNGAAHDTGNGSFTAKWKLPTGGSHLKQDVLWESRVRIPKPVPAFWFSLWTAGVKWNKGAEMDVVESFGTPNIGAGAKAFHVNSVGGVDKYKYSSWPSELSGLGVPSADRDLAEWHVFSWVYLRDDTYRVYFDDHLVQEGTLIWTLGGRSGGEVIDMWFLFDFSWGHTEVNEVKMSLPASDFPVIYELDYSRVYIRE